MKKFLNLTAPTSEANHEEPVKWKNISRKDIAIIGMSARMASAETADEFWQMLQEGVDAVEEFPQARRADVQTYLDFLRQSGFDEEGLEFSLGGYFPEVDKFDYSLFNLSPKEASLIDPNQRMFLESAWAAIEDAGYGNQKLVGTRTGVYIGYSNDFYDDYRRHLLTADSNSYALGTVSNIKSIMASRIAYLLDLKGPSLVVDTACSSSLVAVALACQAIRNGECDQAIAGGVKVLLTPIKGEKRWELGIQSSDGRAHTFDDSSDGTGTGEGVAAFLLKPLQQALHDGDPIYAVIKGVAMNQDGNGIGLTAPNAAAQEDLLLRAWRDAGIDPETISYIEAHGTGTRLGDPIEISGMQRAFRHHTTKKQFCAVGSVKTNIGHLDSAAGMAGLVKLIKALEHGMLPASLYFDRPNRKIPFEDSPVYVNDRLTAWEASSDHPRRCGISSFGLSGTNCHLVLEEAPELAEQAASSAPTVQLLVLSAKSKEGIEKLLRDYHRLLQDDVANLADVCYTASASRGHYNHRLGMVVSSREDACNKLMQLMETGLPSESMPGICYEQRRPVREEIARQTPGDLTESRKQQLSEQAKQRVATLRQTPSATDAWEQLCSLYATGADVEWEALYQGQQRRKVRVPVYPFDRKRCWVSSSSSATSSEKGLLASDEVKAERLHPVLHHRLAETMESTIYATELRVEEQWVLQEHKVFGSYVVPGTTYLEIARQVGNLHFPDQQVELQEVMFLSPLSVLDGETRGVQVVVKLNNGGLEFNVTSKREEDGVWIQHATGKIMPVAVEQAPTHDVSAIIARSEREVAVDYTNVTFGAIETGPRWNNICHVYIGEQEVLLHMSLPEAYTDDLTSYGLHPALLDCAVNAANLLSANGTYLPFLYKSFRIYGPTPAKFYSWSRRIDPERENGETARFEIILFDEDGRTFADIHDYTIKKVHVGGHQLTTREPQYHALHWVAAPVAPQELSTEAAGAVLLFDDESLLSASLGARLEASGRRVIRVNRTAQEFAQAGNRFAIRGSEADFEQLLQKLEDVRLEQVLYMPGTRPLGDTTSLQEAAEAERQDTVELFRFVKALVAVKGREEIEVLLIGRHAHAVQEDQQDVNPRLAALFGLGKVIEQEYPNLRVRSLDLDRKASAETILQELQNSEQAYSVAYRDGVRYEQQLTSLALQQVPEQSLTIHPNGVYVITGGLGGIGLEMAKYLAGRENVQLVLVNRTEMPSRAEWDDIVSKAYDQQASAKIKAIRELESLGAQVHLYRADVSRESELRPLLADVRQTCGPIHGILHGAGVAGDGFLIRKSEETFVGVLAPKVDGTYLLDRLTQEDPLDFFVLFSSINALTAGPGQGDYTAANAYLDAFAAARRTSGRRVISINWPAWKDTGMAVRFGVKDAKGLLKGISTPQAVLAFDRILHHSCTQVIVGDLDVQTIATFEGKLPLQLAPDVRKWVEQKSASAAQVKKGGSKTGASDLSVKLIGVPEEDITEQELKLAKAWSTVLGLQEIDVYENFSDLGGDSILATQLLRELEKEFPGQFDISDIFTYSTILEMNAYLETKIQKQQAKLSAQAKEEEDDLALDDLLERLAKGEISASEASSLLEGSDEE